MKLRSRPVQVLIVCVLAALMLSYARFAIVEPIFNWEASDLAINYSAATVLRGGGSIYDSVALRQAHEAHIGPAGTLYQAAFLTYINPPTTALFFWPLSFLPFPAAQTIFVLLNNAAFLLAVGLLLYRLHASPPVALICVAVCTQIFFYPIRQTFGLGQMNGILAAIMAAALVATLDRRDGWAGALIVLAASIKISPILLLGFFIAQRRTRVWLGAALSAALLIAVMIVTVGFEPLAYFVSSILPVVSRGSASYPNQSLLGAIYRFVVPADSINFQGAMSDYPLARSIWLALSAVLALTTLYMVARSKLSEPSAITVALSTFIVLGLLIGSLAWDHYLLWLVVPVIALTVDWSNTRWLRASIFWSIMSVSLIAINLPIPLQAGLYSSIGPIGTSISTWGMIGLLMLCWGRLGSAIRRQAIQS